MNPVRRIVTSLSEPRVLTGLTVASYTSLAVITVLLWPRLIPAVAPMPWRIALVYLTPALFLTFGVIVGIPASWSGGQWAARWERAALISCLGGLVGGTLFEAWPLLGNDFAGILLTGLALIVGLSIFARLYWLTTAYDL